MGAAIMTKKWTETLRRRRAENVAAGLCRDCGAQITPADLVRKPGRGRPPSGYRCLKCRGPRRVHAEKYRSKDQ